MNEHIHISMLEKNNKSNSSKINKSFLNDDSSINNEIIEVENINDEIKLPLASLISILTKESRSIFDDSDYVNTINNYDEFQNFLLVIFSIDTDFLYN
jgi:hypothetical protein